MFIQLVMPSNYLILCLPFSSCPQSFPASGSFPLSPLHIRWPKYWGFSFNISPSNEYSGLISFRIDCFHYFAVQETQAFSGTIIQKHQFFSTQPFFWSNSHSHTRLMEIITLTFVKGLIQTFISKVISLLFNMRSRTAIAFLPRGKHLLILWL